MEQEECCDEVETVWEYTYLGDRVRTGGGCEDALTARTIFGWHGRRFALKLKGVVCRSCVRPTILYGSEAWCMKENDLGILQRTEGSVLREMCGVQIKD